MVTQRINDQEPAKSSFDSQIVICNLYWILKPWSIWIWNNEILNLWRISTRNGPKEILNMIGYSIFQMSANLLIYTVLKCQYWQLYIQVCNIFWINVNSVDMRLHDNCNHKKVWSHLQRTTYFTTLFTEFQRCNQIRKKKKIKKKQTS